MSQATCITNKLKKINWKGLAFQHSSFIHQFRDIPVKVPDALLLTELPTSDSSTLNSVTHVQNQTEFLAPDLGKAQAWLLQSFDSSRSEPQDDSSLCLYLCVCISLFPVTHVNKKMIFENKRRYSEHIVHTVINPVLTQSSLVIGNSRFSVPTSKHMIRACIQRSYTY